MRITQTQLQNLALNSITDARANTFERQKVASTGKRIDSPSDDPTGSAQARLLNSLRYETNAYLGNVNFAKLRLEQAEQALSESANVVVRARELALAMANGTVGTEQRNLAAAEVGSLRATLIDLANTKQGNEFIFANTNTNNPPVDPSGTFSYDPNLFNNVREIEFGPTARGAISGSASEAFAQRGAAPNSIDVFSTMQTLITNLQNNDPTAIRSSIDELNRAFDQLNAERTQIGIRTNRAQNAEYSANQAESLYKSLEGEIVDADAAEAFSQLSLAQNSLQAAVTISARILGPSLIDVL